MAAWEIWNWNWSIPLPFLNIPVFLHQLLNNTNICLKGSINLISWWHSLSQINVDQERDHLFLSSLCRQTFSQWAKQGHPITTDEHKCHRPLRRKQPGKDESRLSDCLGCQATHSWCLTRGAGRAAWVFNQQSGDNSLPFGIGLRNEAEEQHTFSRNSNTFLLSIHLVGWLNFSHAQLCCLFS